MLKILKNTFIQAFILLTFINNLSFAAVELTYEGINSQLLSPLKKWVISDNYIKTAGSIYDINRKELISIDHTSKEYHVLTLNKLVQSFERMDKAIQAMSTKNPNFSPEKEFNPPVKAIDAGTSNQYLFPCDVYKITEQQAYGNMKQENIGTLCIADAKHLGFSETAKEKITKALKEYTQANRMDLHILYQDKKISIFDLGFPVYINTTDHSYQLSSMKALKNKTDFLIPEGYKKKMYKDFFDLVAEDIQSMAKAFEIQE